MSNCGVGAVRWTELRSSSERKTKRKEEFKKTRRREENR
jgi:hypothetical protein